VREAPLREQARQVLRRWLIDGRLVPGQDLNERMIGDQLGVSRTPVREALLLLTLEGFVSMSPYEGYYVAPLTREEGEDLFRLIAIMERVALVRGDPPTEEELTHLDELDARRLVTEVPAESVELDREWHETLLPGERVGPVYREELSRLHNRLDRYERALGLDAPSRAELVGEHQAIVQTIRAGDFHEAGRLLEEHWLWPLRSGILWPAESEERH
jgi:DNA-binding GntR family transcriptional regulator